MVVEVPTEKNKASDKTARICKVSNTMLSDVFQCIACISVRAVKAARGCL